MWTAFGMDHRARGRLDQRRRVFYASSSEGDLEVDGEKFKSTIPARRRVAPLREQKPNHFNACRFSSLLEANIMNYVFAWYWRPAFHVHLPGEFANYRMIVCLQVNGVTGEVLSYSIIFADLIKNVHRMPFEKRDSGELFAKTNALRMDYKKHLFKLDTNFLRNSSDTVRFKRTDSNGDFERRWLRSFYDWHHDELEQVADPYRIMLGTLKQMLERAILRMNGGDTCPVSR